MFRLHKQGWDTFDLIDLLARRLNIPKADVALGGIKDRHGSTEQLISIRSRAGLLQALAPPRPEDSFNLTFLGYRPEPISAKDIRGNHFRITIRDIAPERLDRCREEAQHVARWGVPNYYDEQRFASARHGKGFMGREIFRGSREKALRLYFQPAGKDNPKLRALKACVLENWYRWQECRERAFGEYRGVLSYLCEHRRAFHKALAHIDRRYLLFVLNAYQSYLFNRILSRYLEARAERHGVPLQQVPYSRGSFLFYGELPAGFFEQLRTRQLPVPGWDSTFEDAEIAGITAEILESEGLQLRDLKVRQLSGLYVNGVQRAAVLLPEDFRVEEFGADDLYEKRSKLCLSFFLPRGGYATLIVKRLQTAAAEAIHTAGDEP